MANFMYQRRKLLGWFHSGKQSDLAAVGETFRGCDALGVAQFHALRLHKLEQSFTVSAHVALHFRESWQFLAFRLADVEHVHGPEADELLFRFTFVGCIIAVYVGRDFVLARPTVADHR